MISRHIPQLSVIYFVSDKDLEVLFASIEQMREIYGEG